MITFSTALIAVVFFALLLMVLFVCMATLTYAYKVHKWHRACRHLEATRDVHLQKIMDNELTLVKALHEVGERHDRILNIVSLTNEVLSLAQEQARKSSVPPKGPGDV